MREPLLVLDAQLKVVFANPAFYRTFQVSAADTEGRFVYELGDRQWDIPELRVLLEQILPQNSHFENFEVEREFPGIGRRTFWLHGRRLETAGGKTERIFLALEDVTQRKALEAELRQAQKMEAVGRLAGGIAHDFNNVLSAILAYAGLALERLRPGDPLREDLLEIQRAAQHAAGLTRQLLAFSRRQILQPEVVDLNQIVSGMDGLLRRLLGEDIELIEVSWPEPLPVKVDPGQMEQVIMNLAVNARDAMPNGGKLTIELQPVELDSRYAARRVGVTPGAYVLLAVSDTGIGMDRQTMERIFEPFFTTKEPGKGTGLGLSTVYGIVKQSGGNIWVYSEPGRGATFKIYLPRAREAPVPRKPSQPVAAGRTGSETILLVEDDPAVRNAVARILRSAGYTVLPAGNPGEALLVCERHPGAIHLVLTDVVMPQMSGRELVQRLAEVRPGLRVLYTSGYTENAVVHHGVLEPGVQFLAKPVEMGELLRKVREVLDAPASPPKPGGAA